MAGARRVGHASVSARENSSSLCDDAFCACCGRRVSGRAGGQASERATGRPGERAGRHAGGSTVPWGWCGRACTGLARAHQRAHGDIPTPPDKSLTRTYLSQRSLYFVHVPPPVIPATSGRTARSFKLVTPQHPSPEQPGHGSGGRHCSCLLLLFSPGMLCQPTMNVGGERSRALSDLVPPARMSPGWLTVLEGNNGM